MGRSLYGRQSSGDVLWRQTSWGASQTDSPLRVSPAACRAWTPSPGRLRTQNGRISSWFISWLLWTQRQGVSFWRTCTHFVLLRHEYWAGLISLLAVVNPPHLQRRSPGDSGGAELWSSVPSNQTFVWTYSANMIVDLHLLHRLCVCFSLRAPSALWICKQWTLSTESCGLKHELDLFGSFCRLAAWMFACVVIDTLHDILSALALWPTDIPYFRAVKCLTVPQSPRWHLEMSFFSQNLNIFN